MKNPQVVMMKEPTFPPHFPHFPRLAALVRIAAVLSLLVLPMLSGCRGSKPDIDQTGGTTFIVQIQPSTGDDGKPVPPAAKDTADMILTLKKRFAKAKFPGAFFTDNGNGEIHVDLPGIVGDEAKKAREIITFLGHLELRKVNLDGFRPQSDGRTLAEQVLAGDHIVPGYKAVVHEYTDMDGNPESEALLLARKAALDSSDVMIASPSSFDPTMLDIKLSGEGEDKMIALTKAMTPGRDRIAIVLDDKVMSAPVVQSVPLGRQFVITGLSGLEESSVLASALNAPLKFHLKILEERTVSPELARKAAGSSP